MTDHRDALIEVQPRPRWKELARPGCHGVRARVLLHREGLMVANLELGTEATIDRHSAPHEIDVIVLRGAGWVSTGDATLAVEAGQVVRWPAHTEHCLWTDGDVLETLMIERLRRLSDCSG
jgi:quercetin dioxygenase-like cupin family protein